jgi:hypothetical protein
MKKAIKACIIFVSLLMLVCCLSVCAVADDSGGVLLISNGNKNEKAKVSYALDVIANDKPMVMTGICGNVLNFSSERFACAMNLSKIEKITIKSLPSAVCGALYIGSEGVSVGQSIKAEDIHLMTYEEATLGVGSNTAFTFTVNDSPYEIACNIYMIEGINYAPTVNIAPYASLNLDTYRDIAISGVLSACDPEGDEMTFEIVKYPVNGLVELTDNNLGTYTYTPSALYTGNDSFCYVVYDKYGNYSAAAKVNLTVSAPGISTVYSDMIGNDLYSHAISMTENGLMNGIQVGDYYYFEADREVSRAEFLITAMNAVGIKSVPDVECSGFYDDADISSEMKGYVALAYSKGYISGTKVDGNIYFLPDEKIKLSEAAVIISNMIGYAEAQVETVFADADEIPAWSGKAIESLHTLGILEVPDKTVGADVTITRGNMAKLLNKTMLVIGK